MDFQLFKAKNNDDSHNSDIGASDVIAWDPDYTKLTPSEAESLSLAEKGEFIRDANIDWDNLSRCV